MKKKKRFISITILFFEISLMATGIVVYPKIFQVNAWGSQEEIPVNLPLVIYFNQPMISQSVEENLIINPPLVVKFIWRDNFRQLTLVPDQLLQEETTYRVSIKEGRSFTGLSIKDQTLVFSTKKDLLLAQELPEARPTQKMIKIDLTRQRLSTWQDGKMLGEYMTSTGKRKTPTKAGNFEVLTKLKMAYGCGDGQCWKMPYWLGFYMVGSIENGIHELPYINTGGGWFKEGPGSLGTPVSHGCVRLDVGIAETIYNWTATGTPVIAHY